MPKNVVITGANGGFGRLTTLSLLNRGHAVAAGIRDVDGRNRRAADELREAGAHVVELDVTNDAAVTAAIAHAIDTFGNVDVVIHNAGVGSLGLFETFSLDDWYASFEVNLFGVQRVNRAALPFMRARGSGLLIYVSSIAGRVALPYFGPYNAAKFALEGLAETSRSELSSLGIESCVVEPGPYPTNFVGSLMKPSDQTRDATYGDLAHAPRIMVSSFEGAMAANPDQNSQHVADAIVALIETPAGTRPFRTVVDEMGMGDAVEPLNDVAEQTIATMYGALGLAVMLEVNTTEP